MVDKLPSAGVSQELPLLSPQRNIHSESITLTKNQKNMYAKYFVGNDTSEVWGKTRSIGIQCDLLAAVSLQKFGTESIEEPLSTSDTEEADLDTSFQLTQEDNPQIKYKYSLTLQLSLLTQ